MAYGASSIHTLDKAVPCWRLQQIRFTYDFFWLWDLRASSVWRWDCTVSAASRQVGIFGWLVMMRFSCCIIQRCDEFIPGRCNLLIVSNRPCHDWCKISGSWFARASNSRCTVLASYENARGRVVDDTDPDALKNDVFGFFWMNSHPGHTAEKTRITCDVSALQDALSHL